MPAHATSGIGVGHRRNLPRVEERLLAARHLGGDVGFVHRLVREHRLADDVADREDVRHVGAHLLVDVDEAAIGDRDAGLLRADLLAVRAAADGDQHEVVAPAARPAPSRPRTPTSMPAFVAFAPTVLVFSITLSKRVRSPSPTP